MFQHTGMEMGENLRATMANALTAYKEINEHLPERIIIFRDGVGDGQVSCVCVCYYLKCYISQDIVCAKPFSSFSLYF